MLPVRELPQWIFAGLSERIAHGLYPWQRLLVPFLTKQKCLKDLLETYSTVENMIARIKENLISSYFFSWEDRTNYLVEFNNLFGQKTSAEIKQDADEICNHNFDLLGSGKIHLCKNIDWHTDFASGRRWPLYPSKHVPIEYDDGSDIIRVWQLSRFQWGPTIGKAYWITNNHKYSKEFLNQVDHWITANPCGYGPNWQSAQDVALRAISWICTLTFIGNSENISRLRWVDLICSLYFHGLHIYDNMSINHIKGTRTTSNHYISELLGLLYLGLLFKDATKGKELLRYCTDELLSEMLYQVHPDGADYESSISYHRFVLEHFVSMYLLCLQNGIKVPDTIKLRLEKMFEFVMAYTRPDGSVPKIGDGDDSRVHIFADYYNWKKTDHRYLLRIGADLFGREEFINASGKSREEAFWLCRRAKIKNLLPAEICRAKKLDPEKSTAFTDAGFYFMKSADNYMAISANPVGTSGKGNHKHNDIFSFDLFLGVQPFIVDPGSYVYTADKAARNLFRSTGYHNTLLIDQQEINQFSHECLWRMKENAYPSVTKWESCNNYDYFQGMHYAYLRLLNPLIHERRIFFDKAHVFWLIQDLVYSGNKQGARPENPINNEQVHRLEIFFHFHPMTLETGYHSVLLDAARYEEGLSNRIKLTSPMANRIFTVKGQAGGASDFVLQFLGVPDSTKFEVYEGWVSESYGLREQAPILRLESFCNIPASIVYCIVKAENS